MTLMLDTVSFSENFTRQQPRKFTLIGRTQSNTEADFTSVTHTKVIVSHATSRDIASELVTYTDLMTHNAGWLLLDLSAAQLEALPLGTFPVEIVVSEDGTNFIVAAQGTFNFLPNIWTP